MSTDISAIIKSFFFRYSQEFRRGKLEAFEIIIALAVSHAYGCCNPKQWADYLGIQPQKIYAQIQTWSLYRLKEVLISQDGASSSKRDPRSQKKKCCQPVTSQYYYGSG
jgi:hypothetical protein